MLAIRLSDRPGSVNEKDGQLLVGRFPQAEEPFLGNRAHPFTTPDPRLKTELAICLQMRFSLELIYSSHQISEFLSVTGVMLFRNGFVAERSFGVGSLVRSSVPGNYETNSCFHTAGRLEFCMLDTGYSSNLHRPGQCAPRPEGHQEAAKSAKQGSQETAESNEEIREGATEGGQKGSTSRLNPRYEWHVPGVTKQRHTFP